MGKVKYMGTYAFVKINQRNRRQDDLAKVVTELFLASQCLTWEPFRILLKSNDNFIGRSRQMMRELSSWWVTAI